MNVRELRKVLLHLSLKLNGSLIDDKVYEQNQSIQYEIQLHYKYCQHFRSNEIRRNVA